MNTLNKRRIKSDKQIELIMKNLPKCIANYFLKGTGQKSTGDTLARCDTLARSDTLARRHFSTE